MGVTDTSISYEQGEQDDDEVQQESVDPESPDPEPEQQEDGEEEHDDKDDDEDEAEEEDSEQNIGARLTNPSDDDEAEELETQDDEVDAHRPVKKRRVAILDDDDENGDENSEQESTSNDNAAEFKGLLSDDDGDESSEEVKTAPRKTINDDDEEDDSEENGNANDDDESSDSDQEVAEDEVAEDKDDEKAQSSGDDQDERQDDEDDEDNQGSQTRNTTLYDFDIMMAKKKEENSKKRRRRNYDIINDNDDIIADIINQMKDAVEADNEANKNKTAATKKLKLLPFVISQLRKVDLRNAFLDSDVLSVMTEWLAPLPDRSLPHLNIRENLLRILIDFNLNDVDQIKGSGIGKAIMYLYKHPKETRENKQRAKQLISCWSRPIFQLDSSFNSISREEREQRDLELMSKKIRIAKHNDSSDGEGAGPSSAVKKSKEEVPQKPGDKGWIPRARVPAPSTRDYVIRPRSKVDGDVGKSSRRPANMLEKYMKNQQDRRRANRQQRAVNMKIDRV